MPDPIYPVARWRPGANADNGHTTMESAVCHYTVGRDSTSIGDRGFFHFLVARDGRVFQFARADAICFHAGDPWNERGPGIEVEYLPDYDDEIFTPEAEAATALLVAWLEDEWGIPAEFYDGARRNVWHGFITHRSLIQTGDYHSDWWPYLPTITDPGPIPLPEEDDMPTIIKDDSNPQRTLLVTADEVYEVASLTTANVVCTKAQADYIIADVRAKYQARNP